MIERPDLVEQVRRGLRRSRVVALVGPRQSGKTTLARGFLDPRDPRYFDLEEPASLARLEALQTALAPLRGTIVIDEIQRRPELFELLRVLVDRQPLPARFLILGSASPALFRKSSETLAGRVETIEVSGFSLPEVGPARLGRRWLRGRFPRSFLARSEGDSLAWRRDFFRTFLERELPALGVAVPPAALLRFQSMLAHIHGGVWNAAEPARSLGLSEPKVRRYLDLLEGLFLVRQLRPWHANLAKRQVKSPKIYFRDSGLLHLLLGIGSERELLGHPRCGASWEGFVLEDVVRSAPSADAYFWATHTGAELDLLLVAGGRRYGVEIKRTDAPRMTPSLRIAREDLGLARIAVVYPGPLRYSIDGGIEAVPAEAVAMGFAGLFPPRVDSR